MIILQTDALVKRFFEIEQTFLRAILFIAARNTYTVTQIISWNRKENKDLQKVQFLRMARIFITTFKFYMQANKSYEIKRSSYWKKREGEV